jgi:hypothetical protein
MIKFKLKAFDEEQVTFLCEKCHDIENKLSNNDDVLEEIKVFNTYVNTPQDREDFLGYYGAYSTETYIKILLLPKQKIDKDLTKEDYIYLIKLIYECQGEEYDIEYWLSILEVNLHPKIMDFIYYPTDDKEMTAEEIYQEATNAKNN